jgi:hypothetical protein
MREAKEILTFTLLLIVIAGVWFLFGVRYGRRTARERVRLEVVNDTTIITTHDTIVRERPVFVTSYIYDTIRTHFTTIEHDTVTVDLPMERRIYKEDSLYYACVSGFRPSLDTLIVWPTITTITIRERERIPAPRWGFAATVGPSLITTPKGSLHAGFGVTAGISYRF